MAIRQSVLALYGAVSDGLGALNEASLSPTEANELRIAAKEIVGLTGSAGERGWYGELFRYFNEPDHLTESGRPVVPQTIDQALEDFANEAEILTPTWAYHAIAAAYVLDQLASSGIGVTDAPPDGFLVPTIAAAPAESEGLERITRVGTTAAQGLADQLRGIAITDSRKGFLQGMKAMSGTLNTAVASMEITSGLRKVKREYCSVVTTTAEWKSISYTKLQRAIEPSNWEKFYDEFFCDMDVIGEDAQGWTRVHEAVSGECSRYKLRTALKFWKATHKTGLFLNYDMDPDRGATDRLVLVDNGYIWITPLDVAHPDRGVSVRTAKQLLISGMSATAMTKLAESLGYGTNASDMFFYANDYTGALDAYAPSLLQLPPIPDTSTTWPVIIPQMPADIRDEMCRDTTQFLKDRLDWAEEFGDEFGADWVDGIDVKEFNELADDVGTEITAATKEAFKMATDNFRPKTPTPQGP
jgi:hypothetical protein